MKYLYLGTGQSKGYDLLTLKPEKLTSKSKLISRIKSRFILYHMLEGYAGSNVVLFEKGCRNTYYLFLTGILLKNNKKIIKVNQDGHNFSINEATKTEIVIDDNPYRIKYITKSMLIRLEKHLDALDKVKRIDIDIVYRSDLIILGYLYSTKYAKKLRPCFKTSVDKRVTSLFKRQRLMNAQALKNKE